MTLAPVTPDPEDPMLRERLNRTEIAEATGAERETILLAVSESHYAHEQELPLHAWFGLRQLEMHELLEGKTVLDLGCFVAGTAVAQAEAYGPSHVYGIDIDNRLLDAARCFTRDAGDRFEFHCGTGEQHPLPDAAVDAIITQDTLEHVANPLATLRECMRVLRPSGLMFCVFPSFYHPWGAHLNLVTNMPWLHLLFGDDVLEAAYRSLVDERGEDAYWYRPGNDLEVQRRRFYSVNGITARGFRRDATTAGLTIVHRNVVPLFGLGRRMKGLPALRAAAVALRWLAGVPVLEEALLHRACYVLQKPPATTAASQNPRLMAR